MSTLRLVCMKEEQQRFLSLLGQLPARLTAEQAGWVLNCQPHDIPALVNARLLKNRSVIFPQISTKYFATADVLEMTKDRVWLVKVSNTICQHWQKQNARKKATELQWVGEWSCFFGGSLAAVSLNIILSAVRKAARQRSGQRERMTDSKGQRPLARGLGMAQIPKTPKAVESPGLNRFVYSGGFKPRLPFAAWPLPLSFRIPQVTAR